MASGAASGGQTAAPTNSDATPNPPIESSYPRLWEAARQVATALQKEGGPVRLVGHYDCDGLTSSAILAAALHRARIPFQLVNITGLNSETLQQIESESPSRLLFSDLGSGQRELLAGLEADLVMVVDHHLPQGSPQAKLLELNAHDLGVDGTHEACAASLALAVAVSLDERNWDLVQPALAGIIGDRQHLPHPRGFNRELIARGLKLGHLSSGAGLALAPDKTLTAALADSLDPYFVGLAGRPERAEAWLAELGFDPGGRLADLDRKGLRHLANQLLLKLLDQGATPETVERLFFPAYALKDYPVEAALLADTVNAAGREGRRDLGVAAALGDLVALEELEPLQAGFEAKVRQGLMKLETEATLPSPRGRYAYFVSPDPSVKGAVAGLAAAYWACRERPLLALSLREAKLEVSSRASQALVANGVDLARVMAAAAAACGGQGGGHPVAAGATVEAASQEAFLQAVDQELAGQAS